MKLKSSARSKRRYILIKGKREDVEKAIFDYVGILGWAKAAPFFVAKYRGRLINEIVLCVNRKELQNIRAAFEISEGNIEIKKVSGTLKTILF